MSTGKDVTSSLPARARRKRAVRLSAAVIGDMTTMDHLSPDGDTGVSLSGNTTALIVRGVATRWLEGYPAGSKRAEEVVAKLQHFVSPAEKVGLVATHDTMEYQTAFKTFGYRHRLSTPGRPRTN